MIAAAHSLLVSFERDQCAMVQAEERASGDPPPAQLLNGDGTPLHVRDALTRSGTNPTRPVATSDTLQTLPLGALAPTSEPASISPTFGAESSLTESRVHIASDDGDSGWPGEWPESASRAPSPPPALATMQSKPAIRGLGEQQQRLKTAEDRWADVQTWRGAPPCFRSSSARVAA